jgi:hypothetical protein
LIKMHHEPVAPVKTPPKPKTAATVSAKAAAGAATSIADLQKPAPRKRTK